jgi:hypothetical protein
MLLTLVEFGKTLPIFFVRHIYFFIAKPLGVEKLIQWFWKRSVVIV